ncbi:MAG: hypothetical protein ACXAE3_01555 [Candidatus Kariarchaeaceae archaeon]|jgi:hypothetical protein
MVILDRITELMNLEEGDLGQITAQLVGLVKEAKETGENIPLDIHLEILLQANYVLGFGGAIGEIQMLANLLLQLLDTELGAYSAARLQRLGCTVSSALISHLSSSQHLANKAVTALVPWTETDSQPSHVLGGLLKHLSRLLVLEDHSEWTLELITFLVTIELLLEDMDSINGLTSESKQRIKSIFQEMQGSSTFSSWSQSLLEKSDYYRFVTLMMTQVSRDEEIWLDHMKQLLP